MNINNWKISQKIVIGFILLLAIQVAVAVILYNGLLQADADSQLVTHTNDVKNQMNALQSDLKDAETGQRGYIITGDDTYLQPYNSALTAISADLTNLHTLIQAADVKAAMQPVDGLVASKLAELKQTIDLRRTGGFEAAQAMVATNAGQVTMDAIRTDVASAEKIENDLLVQRTAASAAANRLLQWVIIGGSLALAVLLIIVAVVLTRSIATPLKEAIGLLGSSASEILASTTQVASGTAETSTAINETTTTVEEVRQAAQLSSQKALSVSDNAQRVSQVSQSGQKAVEDTSAGMDRIREQMETIAQTVVRLSEQSQSIGGIIASVTDLADQSNLLAVNAAIEAAKAGEQGKGFTVVAQEIKSLAEQSKQATAQVRGILSDVQKATSNAVMATEQGSKAVEAGIKQAAQAGEAIRSLAETTNEAVQTAIQIVTSSQQQVVGMDQIGVAMEGINQAGSQTAASMKQLELAAQNLHELGEKLKHLVV
jgi:methyl-accepting chemotaxis protein